MVTTLARALPRATTVIRHSSTLTSNAIASANASASASASANANDESELPRALRVATAAYGELVDDARARSAVRRHALALARQHVGVVRTFEQDANGAVRRAVRDAFGRARDGVRVGRRVRARAEVLLETLRQRIGGDVRTTERGDLSVDSRALSIAPSTNVKAIASGATTAVKWDDDIEWGARLSKRKLRRIEAKDDLENKGSLRAEKREANGMALEERDAAAYAVMRSPMKMAAMKRIFYEIRDRLGDAFEPGSVLDFGSGPVPTTAMAMRDVFGFDIKEKRSASAGEVDVRVALVDGNAEMMRFARRVVGYAERERGEREERERNLPLASDFGEEETEAEEDVKVAANVRDGSIIRLDFTDFEAEDKKALMKSASAMRLMTQHPWHEADGVRTAASLRGANRRDGFDVVVSNYALGEIPADTSATFTQRSMDVTVRQLWDRVAPGGVLVIAEPGTPRGSLIVRRARALILEVARLDMEQHARRREIKPSEADIQAYVVAPCQHDKACPLKDEHREDGFSTWCHFQQRGMRSAYYREINQSAKPYQDEKFSYVVLRKSSRDRARRDAESATRRAADERRIEALASDGVPHRPSAPDDENNTADNETDDEEEEEDEGEDGEEEDKFHTSLARESAEDWSRVIRHPHKRKGHVVVELCTPRGEIERAVIAKSHGQGSWAIGADGYKFARKLRWGDLWPFANKTVIRPGEQRLAMLSAAEFREEFLLTHANERANESQAAIVDPEILALLSTLDDETETETETGER